VSAGSSGARSQAHATALDPVRTWNELALATVRTRSLSDAEAARLYAMVDVAVYDAVNGIVSERGRRSARGFALVPPAGAPRHGDLDAAASAAADVSGAGAAVLAGFFCDDRIPFSLVTDSAPGGRARTYPSFSAAAAEAGRSRVVGGIHFEFSNQEALASGRAVAAEILAGKLLRKDGPTHFGRCPV
jgi:hypothetical protein